MANIIALTSNKDNTSKLSSLPYESLITWTQRLWNKQQQQKTQAPLIISIKTTRKKGTYNILGPQVLYIW